MLDLRDNSITVIKHQFFYHLTSLNTLYLSHNSIHGIEPGSFKQLTNLSTLDLGHNEIDKLDKGMFTGLKSLLTLIIQYNSINVIDKEAFKPISSTKLLDLNNNFNFKHVTNGTFHYLNQLESVYFDRFYMCSYVPKVRLLMFVNCMSMYIEWCVSLSLCLFV